MYANINGLKVHYVIEGNGIPCVIPSLGGTLSYERMFSAELRRHLKLVFAELRGSRSDLGEVGAATLDTIVDDLDRLRSELKLDRIVVLGHSGHGFIALRYAAKYPDRISHAVLVGAAPSFDGTWFAEVLRYSEMLMSNERKDELARSHDRLRPAMSRATPDEAVVLNFIANAPIQFFDAHFDCAHLWKDQTFNAQIFQRFWGPGGEFSKFDPATEFPRIKCPVLIASGLFDYGCPPTTWHGIIDKLAKHEYRVFERSGHHPQMEEQSLFDQTVVEWIKRN